MIPEYRNKPFIVHQEEDEIWAVQESDGKLKPEQESQCPEV
jgi:hypothetical protein